MYRGLADYNMDVYVQPESRYLSDNAADLHEPPPLVRDIPTDRRLMASYSLRREERRPSARPSSPKVASVLAWTTQKIGNSSLPINLRPPVSVSRTRQLARQLKCRALVIPLDARAYSYVAGEDRQIEAYSFPFFVPPGFITLVVWYIYIFIYLLGSQRHNSVPCSVLDFYRLCIRIK